MAKQVNWRTSGLGKLFQRLGAFQLNMLVQALGTSLSQIILVLASPILTRLFGPEEFGIYGLVFSISTLLAIIITFRVDHGVIVAPSDEQAKEVAILALILALAGSIACGFAGLIFASGFYGIDGSHLLVWSIFGPGVAFLTAANRTLTLYNNRLKHFSLVSYARLTQSILFVLSAAATGLLSFNSYGLIYGLLISNLAYVLLLIRNLQPLHGIKRSKAKTIIGANRNFIRFSLPADLVNTLAARMPFVLFPIFFGLQETGLLSLAYQVIATPSRFVGKAIGEVFYSHAAREYETTGQCWESAKKVALILALLGVPGFVILFILAEPLFAMVFGKQWALSAQYTQIMTPMLLINFVASPLSVVFYITHRQKDDFLWQIAFLATTSLSCCVGIWMGGAIGSLAALSASGSILYLIYFGFIRRFAKGNGR